MGQSLSDLGIKDAVLFRVIPALNHFFTMRVSGAAAETALPPNVPESLGIKAGRVSSYSCVRIRVAHKMRVVLMEKYNRWPALISAAPDRMNLPRAVQR